MKVCSGKTVDTVLRKTVEAGKKVISSSQTKRQITDLPRFSSPEMVMARIQNKIAIRETKAPRVFKFPKASAQDLKRLTSDTIEASYSRVTWVNPKDGKVYHILKEGEFENGNIAVRILNEDGSFLKNADITPKKVIVIDDFEQNQMGIYGLSHGEIVTTFLRRNNPFANVETINIGMAGSMERRFTEAFEQILQRIKSGEKIDYISCSKGGICYSTVPMRGINPEFQAITDIADSGTRVLFAAGNEAAKAKETANQVLLLADKVEGVGSLSPVTHRLSDFSASRNSFLTQHYEVGEHYVRPTEYGANITGLSGTDIVITSPKYQQEVKNNIIIGKTAERVDKLINKIEFEINEIFKKRAKLFVGRIDFKALQKLENRQNTLSQRKLKLLRLRSATRLENGKYEAAEKFFGTSFSTPVRTAKLSLNDMLSGIFV